MRPAEETVVRQCAPTLAGIKTGSLFPCPYDSRQQLLADIRRMNRVLVPRGLCLLPMRLGQGRALLYLYRPQALRRTHHVLRRELNKTRRLQRLAHAKRCRSDEQPRLLLDRSQYSLERSGKID